MTQKNKISRFITAMFVIGAGLVSVAVYAITWSNTNFLTSSFRSQSPSSGDIQTAIFGTGTSPATTAYTSYRPNNTCTGNNTTVQYIGSGQLPQQLTGNTIYVLTGDQYITGTITFSGNCIGLISYSGSKNIRKNTGSNLGSNDIILYATGRSNIAIDGIIFNEGGSNVALYPIYFFNTTGVTIHAVTGTAVGGQFLYARSVSYFYGEDIVAYNGESAGSYGLFIYDTKHIQLKNIYSYSGDNGISVNNSNDVTITNAYVHGMPIGVNEGFEFNTSSGITLNNIQAVNIGGIVSALSIVGVNNLVANNIIIQNSFNGVSISGSSGVVFNNFSVGNNTRDGFLITTSTGIIFHTGMIFNNGLYGIQMSTSTGNYYYGTIQIIDNTSTGTTMLINSNASLITGSATDSNISGLGRSTGNLLSGGVSVFCHFGIVDIFVGQSEPYCTTAGYIGISTRLGIRKYGEQIPLQRQPATYTASGVLQLTGTSTGLYAYDTNLFIGDYPFAGRIRLSGSAYYASGATGYTNTTGILRLYSNQPAVYAITGNITPGYSGTISTTTSVLITRTGADGLKTITGTFTTGGMQTNIYRIYRYFDTTAPTNPTVISPLSGAYFTGNNATGNTITLVWSTGSDSGAGISGYTYQVSLNSGFTNFFASGTIYTTGITLTGLGFYPNYYRRVQSLDNLGQSSGRATTGAFHYGFSGFIVTIGNNSFPTSSGQTITVTAYDISNNIITGYNNTITFAITGITVPPNVPYSAFTTPSNYTFVLADTGSHIFTGGIIITYPGIYEIKAYDTLNSMRSGRVSGTATGSAPLGFSGTMTITPTYTTGNISIVLTASSYPANYQLGGGGAITPVSGTMTTGITITTGFISGLPDASYIFTYILNTGFYTYTTTGIVVLDNTTPVVTIVAPTSNQYLAINNPTLSRSGSEDGTAGFSGYTVVISGTALTYTVVTQQNINSVTVTLPDDIRHMTVYGYDKAGNIGIKTGKFTIDNTAPAILSGYPHQVVIANPFTFSRTVVDTGGLLSSKFTLTDFYGTNLITPTTVFSTTITPTTLGLGTLGANIYKWNVEAVDNVNHTGYTNGGFIFGVANVIPGQLQGFMEFQSSFGSVIKTNSVVYTNTTQVQAALFANITSNVSVNGDIGTNISGVPLLMPFPYTLQAINLTAGDGTKNITALFSSGSLNSYSVTKQIVLDTTAPTTPTQTEPIGAATVSGAITMSRTGANDAGAGMSGYIIEISTGQTFTTLSLSTGTQVKTITLTSGSLATGTYYWRITAYDKLQKSSVSAVESFVITRPGYIPPAIPTTFSIAAITNAIPSILYRSDAVIVAGLATNQQAAVSITTGALFINGILVGTTGVVVNSDIIEIDMIASSSLNTQIASTLTIGTKSAIFTLKTRSSNGTSSTTLTTTQKLQIHIIYDALVDLYKTNPSKDLTFFQTLRNAIESMLTSQNLSQIEEDALNYFLGLVNGHITDLGGGNSLNGSTYTAPNGRVFRIEYEATRVAYTSPDFVQPAYFGSFAAFKLHIDKNNPGSTQGYISGGTVDTLDASDRGADVLATPNGKVYRIQQKSTGKRYSPDMIYPKEFDLEASLRTYLNAHNQ